MSSWIFPGSLRAHVQRVFFVGFLAVAAASLGAVWQLATQTRDRNETAHYAGLSQLLADLVRHPLEISDYSDAQRMLSFVSRDTVIIPAVLTEEGDLLLGDYSRADALGLDDLRPRSGRSCEEVLKTFRSLSQRLFCREIQGVRGGIGAVGDRLGVSLVFVGRRKIVPFWELTWFFGALLISLLALSWIIRRYFTLSVVVPLESLRAWAKARKAHPLAAHPAAPQKFAVEELEDLKSAFAELLESVNHESRKRQETERELALQDLSRQVAHDIRSPLAALETAASDLSQIPEDKRLLLRSAASRIRDIANSLLERHREGSSPQARAANEPTASLLSGLIEPVVTEKRFQYRSRADIAIDAVWDERSYGIFGRVQPADFARAISNLLNNAVEALEDRGGWVKLTLSADQDFATIMIRDNGKGIPAAVLSRLGKEGESYGKAAGTGLGLHHARRSAESWGGRLEIASRVGEGATIKVLVPLAPAPPWFAPELRLRAGQTVVILDDDASVHQVWDERLGPRGPASAPRVEHLYTPIEFSAWIGRNPSVSDALFLLDYELIGHEKTGLSLAEEFALGSSAVLVTSWYEDAEIVERCSKAGLRMIPKGLARLVPIHIGEPERLDAVLIDDDALARTTWKLAAAQGGKRFRSYATVAAFLSDSSEIDPRTPLYIDADLGDGVRGEREAKRLHTRGFLEIYLATGHDPESFSGLAHLRGIVGKQPPWAV